MSFWQWLRVVILGIIEGITEWLPVSSTGHMQLFSKIWPGNPEVFTAEFTSMFDVIIQLGAIIAVIIVFFHKLNPISQYKTSEQRKSTWFLWLKILVAVVPVAIVGIIFDDWIDEHLSSPWIFAATLIFYGIVFIIVELVQRKKEAKITKLPDLSYKTVIIIGLAQILSLIPGTSRSGITIIAALLLGCTRTVAAEFTFFMAIPVMFGASVLRFFKYVFLDNMAISGVQWAVLLVAMAVSFGVSMLVIRAFMKFIKKHDFVPFGIYRIVFGVVIILVYALFFN